MLLKFDIFGTCCHMIIDLGQICKTEDEYTEVKNTAGKWVRVKSYPASRRRKLFKLIIENLTFWTRAY